MKKSRLMAVCAHEYTHAWMHENVSQKRLNALDRNTIEGFCELIAYKYMESEQETQELECIKRNPYTHGQIEVLVEADHQYRLQRGGGMDQVRGGRAAGPGEPRPREGGGWRKLCAPHSAVGKGV